MAAPPNQEGSLFGDNALPAWHLNQKTCSARPNGAILAPDRNLLRKMLFLRVDAG
jgi:hypothetical protein